MSGISEHAWDLLFKYHWPGNVRELENAIRSSLLAAESVIDVEHLPEYLRRSDESESGRRAAPAGLPLPLLTPSPNRV